MNPKDIIDGIKEKLNETFHLGPKGIIGIDIGISAIKLAEVVSLSDGKYKLNKYASIPLPEGSIIEDEIQKEDEVLKALQEGIEELNSTSKFVCIGFSGPNTIIKKLQLAGGNNEEVEDQATWEIEQYLPFPIDEGNISFSVVGENQGGGVDVIAGAIKKTTLETFKSLIERSNLKVKIADLNAAATINVIEAVMGGEVKARGKTWLFLDIGAQKTHFIIYKNGVMAFFKEINIAGLTITEEIQRQMGVNYTEAESLKIEGDGSGNIPVEVVDLMNQVLDSFFSELKKTVDFWVSSSSEEAFDGCIITGGSSLIPGLPEALQELFETEVQILNPFLTMTYNQNNITEEALGEIAHKGVCAIGLALRRLDK